MKILSFKNKSKPKIKWPIPFGMCLMETVFWKCCSKCRTKTVLYCKASHLILITHFLPIQIMCPTVDDTFYVNNIKMKIAQTSYNSVMLLPTLGVFSPNHSLPDSCQICSQQQTHCTMQWNFFFLIFFFKQSFVCFFFFNIIMLIIHRPCRNME